jgi:hypothetical protein
LVGVLWEQRICGIFCKLNSAFETANTPLEEKQEPQFQCVGLPEMPPGAPALQS